jgi:hypothetical protein
LCTLVVIWCIASHRAIVPAAVWRIPTFSIDLLTRGAMRIILIFRRPDPMISGRNVCSVPRFDVATGKVGEARRTAMAHVKSAIETDASSAF